MKQLLNIAIAFCVPVLWWVAEPVCGQIAKPNIVVILADDMGYGDVQALNPSSRIATPHIDQLVRQGMVFTDGHSPSAVCTPTRYGLLTGRYCWRTRLKSGVLGGYSPPLIERERPTIATMLKSAGYRTGAIGKWHLGMALPMASGDGDRTKWDGDPGVDFAGQITDSPIHHGFDYYFGVCASLDMAPYVFVRNDRFTKVPTLQQAAVKFPHFIRQGPRADDFVVDQVLDRLTGEAVEFIEQSARGTQPFFLYLPLTAPHKPTQPHARFRGKTGLSEYGDFVAQVDWSVGQVLGAIQQAGVTDKTLVVYTSDNGSYMYRYDDTTTPDHVDDASIQGYRAEHHRANGPFRGTKADIWEAGHHVPLIVRWPGYVGAGSRRDAPVCLTDLYATFAEIAGVKLEDNCAEDSLSLVALAESPTAGRGAPVIHHSANGMFAIRDGKWKLVAGNGSGGRSSRAGNRSLSHISCTTCPRTWRRPPTWPSNIPRWSSDSQRNWNRSAKTVAAGRMGARWPKAHESGGQGATGATRCGAPCDATQRCSSGSAGSCLAARQAMLTGSLVPDLLERSSTDLFDRLRIRWGAQRVQAAEQRVTLFEINRAWAEHLTQVAEVRDQIHLFSMGGYNPLDEFHRRASTRSWSTRCAASTSEFWRRYKRRANRWMIWTSWPHDSPDPLQPGPT